MPKCYVPGYFVRNGILYNRNFCRLIPGITATGWAFKINVQVDLAVGRKIFRHIQYIGVCLSVSPVIMLFLVEQEIIIGL